MPIYIVLHCQDRATLVYLSAVVSRVLPVYSLCLPVHPPDGGDMGGRWGHGPRFLRAENALQISPVRRTRAGICKKKKKGERMGLGLIRSERGEANVRG
jgi:hypothetical protein